MKVILVFPNQTELDDLINKYPLSGVEYRTNPHISLGMLSLISNTPKYDIEYLDNNIIKYSNEQLIKVLLDKTPDVVGFGGTVTEFPQAKNVSLELRKHGIFTIYGGPNATVRPEKHVKFFDYVVRGMAEVSFGKLLDAISRKNFEPNIEGVCYGTVLKNPVYQLNLSLFAPPDRDAVDITKYRRNFLPFPLPEPVDIVMSSRGCPYDCRFCSSQYIWNRKYNVRPVNHVISEIESMIRKYGTKSVQFREDNFTVDRQRAISFCGELRKLDIKWVCQGRIDTIDADLLKTMKEAGCVGMTCGFESANDSTLEYVGKRTTIDDINKAIQLFIEGGLYWSGGFMVGVLNEGEQEIKTTLEFVRSIMHKPFSIQPQGAMRFIGYPVADTYYEMIKHDLVEYNWQDGEILVSGTHKLSASEVDRVIRENW